MMLQQSINILITIIPEMKMFTVAALRVNVCLSFVEQTGLWVGWFWQRATGSSTHADVSSARLWSWAHMFNSHSKYGPDVKLSSEKTEVSCWVIQWTQKRKRESRVFLPIYVCLFVWLQVCVVVQRVCVFHVSGANDEPIRTRVELKQDPWHQDRFSCLKSWLSGMFDKR